MTVHPQKRFRLALLESPHLPIALYLGLIGVAGLITGAGIAPAPLHDVLPRWMVLLWTACIAAGGVLSTLGAIARKTRVESVGLVALSWGALMYGVIITTLIWPGGITAGAVSAAILSMCLLRMRALSISRQAQRLATSVLQHRDL